MKTLTILFLASHQNRLDTPYGFATYFENQDDAEKALLSIHPDARILWVHFGDYDEALSDYWDMNDIVQSI